MVRSINPTGVPHHKNPIPAAALHRGILVSSAIMGLDPETGRYPDSKSDQIALAFAHLKTVLAEAGASSQDVVKLDLLLADKADRALVNPHWLKLFPDEAARPARHSYSCDLPDGCCLQLVVMAVLGSPE